LQRELDVVLLHDGILKSALGITPQAVTSEKNLAYVRDPCEAVDAVDSKAAQVAFLLNACDVEQVMRIATSGEVMPHKSTDVYPKLRAESPCTAWIPEPADVPGFQRYSPGAVVLALQDQQNLSFVLDGFLRGALLPDILAMTSELSVPHEELRKSSPPVEIAADFVRAVELTSCCPS
jgi:hypothetical protein